MLYFTETPISLLLIYYSCVFSVLLALPYVDALRCYGPITDAV